MADSAGCADTIAVSPELVDPVDAEAVERSGGAVLKQFDFDKKHLVVEGLCKGLLYTSLYSKESILRNSYKPSSRMGWRIESFLLYLSWVSCDF